jgi:hypothetical protein
VFFETLESKYDDELAQHRSKAHERRLRLRRGQDSRESLLGGAQKARRGSTDGSRVKPHRRERTFQMHQSLEPTCERSNSNTRHEGSRGNARQIKSRGGYWEGETSESLNPTDGFGMKKGRRDLGGVTRQEAEKA